MPVGKAKMLVRELMTGELMCSTPSDTARTIANLMKMYGVGAIPVVSKRSDPLLEGIVTDRDLCCRIVADAKNPDVVRILEIMTPVAVTCEPEFTLEDCEELMGQNQVRRIPVVDKRGGCVTATIGARESLLPRAASRSVRRGSTLRRNSGRRAFGKDCGLGGWRSSRDVSRHAVARAWALTLDKL